MSQVDQVAGDARLARPCLSLDNDFLFPGRPNRSSPVGHFLLIVPEGSLYECFRHVSFAPKNMVPGTIFWLWLLRDSYAAACSSAIQLGMKPVCRQPAQPTPLHSS